jgi:uncharacterized protein
LEVYRFLRDDVRAEFIQFIPIVERAPEQAGRTLTGRSVNGGQYGEFLKCVFDEWVRHDVGQVYVQIIDVALAAWIGHPPGLCVFEPTCGQAMALEHNGDLYACDHFVEEAHLLGNIIQTPIAELAALEKQRRFGLEKRDLLPTVCLSCEVRFVCNGGCPKDRLPRSVNGEPGLNVLCEGYRAFFTHIRRPMEFMANELRSRRPPANIMGALRARDLELERRFTEAGRNDPCPCGSGLKFKHCHGSRRNR